MRRVERVGLILVVLVLVADNCLVYHLATRYSTLQAGLRDLHVNVAKRITAYEMVAPPEGSGADTAIRNVGSRGVYRLNHEGLLARFVAKSMVLAGDPSVALSPAQNREVAGRLARNIMGCEDINARDMRIAAAYRRLDDVLTGTQKAYLDQHGDEVRDKMQALLAAARREYAICAAFAKYFQGSPETFGAPKEGAP